ncbi:hypothetical protein LI071_15275 [Bacillus subtilis]|uniref:tubby C-terminal domain-like protein n=1 Tax=Bacillus subtilis TaxID=1423 RepID=UPI001D08CA95|nr:hypothetical protein [Bacillus subtilis]MCB7162033.1 hypothetical protein [Bacillus subtilis]MCB7460279.1 hypothetical protein [Bacillus subtilis]
MGVYSFRKPILKKSKKKINIFNENQTVIGSIQRFYKNKIEFIIDNIFDEFFVNIEVFDENQVSIAKATEILSVNTFLRSKWKLEYNGNKEMIISDITKIKTNPIFQITIGQNQYRLEKDFADKRVRIVNTEKECIATITYDKLIPPTTITINLNKDEEELSITLISCIYYIFLLKD